MNTELRQKIASEVREFAASFSRWPAGNGEVHWNAVATIPLQENRDALNLTQYFSNHRWNGYQLPFSEKTFEELAQAAGLPTTKTIRATFARNLRDEYSPSGLVFQAAHWAGGLHRLPEYIADGGQNARYPQYA